MNVFNSNIFVSVHKVILSEIPKALNTEAYEFVSTFRSVFSSNKKDSNSRLFFFAKFLFIILVKNNKTANSCTYNLRVVIKNTYKLKAFILEIEVSSNSMTEITRTD